MTNVNGDPVSSFIMGMLVNSWVAGVAMILLPYGLNSARLWVRSTYVHLLVITCVTLWGVNLLFLLANTVFESAIMIFVSDIERIFGYQRLVRFEIMVLIGLVLGFIIDRYKFRFHRSRTT